MARKRSQRNTAASGRAAQQPVRPASAQSARASLWPTIAWGAVAPLLAIVVFAQVASFELLQYDDRTNVTDNPHLNPVTLSGVAQFWRAPYAGLYAPLTYTFFALEAVVAERPATATELAMLRPSVFHLGNLLLHFGCVVLVFALVRQLLTNSSFKTGIEPASGATASSSSSALSNPALLGKPAVAPQTGFETAKRNAAACVAACLFAIHPLQVESVAWVTETKGLLAAFWSLAALVLYVCYAQARLEAGAPPSAPASRTSKAQSPRRTPPELPSASAATWYYLAAIAAFALALLSKPTAVAVPLVAFVVDIGLVRRSWRQSLVAIAPWFALALALVYVTQRAQPADALAIDRIELWQRPLVAADAVVFYLRKVVWPWPLGPDYGRTPVVALGSLLGKTAGLLLAALAIAIYWLPGRRLLWTALALFAAALAPVSGVLPFGFQGMSTVADRFVYLAMLAPALLLAGALARGAPRAVWGGVALGIAGLGGLAAWQTSLWRDDGTLFAHNLARVNADSHVAHNNVGVALERQALRTTNADERAALFGRAAEHYDRARRLRPEMDEAWQHLAYVQGLLGRSAEAEATFRQFLARRPDSPSGHFNLGTLLAKQDRPAEAIAEFRAATQLRPDYANAWLSLGVQLVRHGDAAGAIEAIRQALFVGRNSRQIQFNGHLNLARIYLAQERRVAAAEALEMARRLAPQSPEVAEITRQLNASQGAEPGAAPR
ncbi:MAG: tetratricopeptide repeat protein [Pirellulales bacterium]|nr:tetratricopeptide repeat protein [Pirellulales bacterium]